MADLAVELPFPFAALPMLADELRSFGATVQFEDERSGTLTSIAGALRFKHDSDTLRVEVIEHAGHFPRFMLIGGIKQTIQEAAERFRRVHAGN